MLRRCSMLLAVGVVLLAGSLQPADLLAQGYYDEADAYYGDPCECDYGPPLVYQPVVPVYPVYRPVVPYYAPAYYPGYYQERYRSSYRGGYYGVNVYQPYGVYKYRGRLGRYGYRWKEAYYGY